MKRRTLMREAATLALLLSCNFARAADDSKAGKLGADEFKKINAEAGAKVKALEATKTPLSDSDLELVKEIAAGGTMQLKASELAIEKGKSADVKLIAQAEAEEQRGLAAKLKEIAAAKGFTLPAGPDEAGSKMLAKLKEAGDKLDKMYLAESGVKGHEQLKKTMTKVSKEAKDPLLKGLAGLALPLIEVHLTVARDEAETMA